MSLLPLTFWHWLTLGLLLVLLEFVVPGVFLVWLGIAGLVTGVLIWASPIMPWAAQVVTFVFIILLTVLLTAYWSKTWSRKSVGFLGLNCRGEELIGQTLILETAIVNGNGRALVSDGSWKVRGPDAPAGASVRVEATSRPAAPTDVNANR